MLKDKNNLKRIIEKFDHAGLDVGSSLEDFSWKVPVSGIEEVRAASYWSFLAMHRQSNTCHNVTGQPTIPPPNIPQKVR